MNDLTPGESQRDMYAFIGQELAANTDKVLEEERVKWGLPSFQDKNWWETHSRRETSIQSAYAITNYYVNGHRLLTEVLRYEGPGQYRQSFTTYNEAVTVGTDNS